MRWENRRGHLLAIDPNWVVTTLDETRSLLISVTAEMVRQAEHWSKQAETETPPGRVICRSYAISCKHLHEKATDLLLRLEGEDTT